MSSVVTNSTTSTRASAGGPKLPAPPAVISASPSTKSPFFTHLDDLPSFGTHRPTEWLQSPAEAAAASVQTSSLSSDPTDDPYDFLRRYDVDPPTDHDDSCLSIPLASDAGSFAQLHVPARHPGPRERSRSGSLRAAAAAVSRTPATITARTRRHLSKLSFMVAPHDSDADSILSEPASYSTTSYVASDMWLVHRDVDNAERVVKQKERERARDRERHRPRWDSNRTRAVSAAAAVETRQAADMRHADVFSPRNEAQDVSSKLVRMFFSGETTSPVAHKPRRTQVSGARRSRGRFGYRGRGHRYGHEAEEQMEDRFDASGVVRSSDGHEDGDKRKPLKQNQEGRYVDAFEDDFGGYHKKRRFDRARRFRWWIRRIAFKMKGEAE